MHNRKHIKGFSLVELAIVIVIIGLLIGGAVLGNGLMKQAELRSLISEAQSYKIAVGHFTELYGGPPGDIINADGSNGFFNGRTSNGDGDGEIDELTPAGIEETFLAWAHLSLAGFIAGAHTHSAAVALVESGSLFDKYSGQDDASSGVTIGQNVPESTHRGGAGYSMVWDATPASATDALGRSFPGNYLIFAKDSSTPADHVLSGAVLTPEDAFYIDRKLDDGNPAYGIVLGGDAGSCISGGAYDLSVTTQECFLFYALDN